jgi:hypothetical protein
MANKGGIVLIILIIAAVLVVGGSAYSFIKGGDWAGLLNGNGGGSIGGNATGSSAIGFLLHFTDGTSQEIKPEGFQYSLIPLVITVDGKKLSTVDLNVFVNINTNTEITSWTTQTALQSEFYKKPETVPKYSATADYPHTGGSLIGSGDFTVATTTIKASDLDPLVAKYGNGDWLLQVQAKVSLTATIAGQAQTYSASTPSGGLDFTYTGTTVTVTATTGVHWFSVTQP